VNLLPDAKKDGKKFQEKKKKKGKKIGPILREREKGRGDA